jgi:ADP-heptose:LPS heptosyltransferase
LEEIDHTNDIDGLASLVCACDAVVTVSNTTAHLAGALGKPTWVLVPLGHSRIWYWFEDQTESPFYPRVHVWHQANAQSWADLIAQATKQISASLGSPG